MQSSAEQKRNKVQSQAASASLNRIDSGKEHSVILTNTETVPGKRVVEHLGLVQGSTVRAKHVGRDFMAGLKNIVGGELKGYTELLEDARNQAIMRMAEQARAIGADAVLNIRLSTSTITAGAAELLAYGTAVKLGEADHAG